MISELALQMVWVLLLAGVSVLPGEEGVHEGPIPMGQSARPSLTPRVSLPVVVFPCLAALRALPKPPLLRIYGETHNHRPDIERTQSLVNGSAHGDYLVGMESRFYDDHSDPWIWQKDAAGRWWKTPIYGLDDFFTRAVASIPANYFSLVVEMRRRPPVTANLDNGKRAILAELVIIPFNQEAWRVARTRLQNDGARNLGTYIDRLLEKKDNPAEWQASIERMHRDAIWENTQAFVEVQRELARAFLELIESKYVRTQAIPDLQVYRDVLMDPESLAKRRRFVQEIAVRYRNEAAFAKNIALAYCDAVRLRKPLYVVAGQLHIAELRDQLTQASGGTVHVELVPSLATH